MKKRLKLIAIILLICGLASAGFAGWSYFHARTLEALSKSLDSEAFELEDQFDKSTDTPEKNRLLSEAQKSGRAASEALASAKSNSTRAVIFGIGSIILVSASIAVIIVHATSTETDQS